MRTVAKGLVLCPRCRKAIFSPKLRRAVTASFHSTRAKGFSWTWPSYKHAIVLSHPKNRNWSFHVILYKMQKSASETEPRRDGHAKRKRVHVWITVLLTFIGVCLWNWTVSKIHLNWILGNPSIEQRTYKILRDNPLIGTSPPSHSRKMLTDSTRWTQ